MRVLKLILILFISFNSINVISQNNDCDKILDKKINIKRKDVYQSDLELLKKCNYDLNKYDINLIFLAISDMTSKGEDLTYRKLTSKLEEIDLKLKSQLKDQIIISTFKICCIALIIITIIYWTFKSIKNKKVLFKNNN